MQQTGSSTGLQYQATASQTQYADPRIMDPSQWTLTSGSSTPLPPPSPQHSLHQKHSYICSHQSTEPPPKAYETVEQQWLPMESSQGTYHQTPPIPLIPPSAFTQQSHQLSRRRTVSDNQDLYPRARPTTSANPSSLPLLHPSTAAPSAAYSYEYWAGPTSNPLPLAQSQWPASVPLPTSTPAPSYFHLQLDNPPPPPSVFQQSVPNYEWEGAYMAGGGGYIYSYPPGLSDYDTQHTLFDRVARRPSGGGC